MGEHSGRARLITVPEAWATGCETYSAKACPKYMYNYLKNANNYEGIVDENEILDAYWAMNGRSDYTTFAWGVFYNGSVTHDVVGDTSLGACAVVVINK